jgi:hypothetical protein
MTEKQDNFLGKLETIPERKLDDKKIKELAEKYEASLEAFLKPVEEAAVLAIGDNEYTSEDLAEMIKIIKNIRRLKEIQEDSKSEYWKR